MATIKEVFESVGITHDDKARRRLNTAPTMRPNITLDHLESGVTIEELESLNVPVYQYQTQITIHGIFPLECEPGEVNGYHSLIKNGNGSLGVKYAAIDGAKKEVLCRASRLRDKDGNTWGIYQDSRGTMAVKSFVDKQAAIDCYHAAPDALFIGSKAAGCGMWGNYLVILYIGAVYASELWELCQVLTGINSLAEIEKQEADQRKADEERSAKYRAEWAAEESKRNAEVKQTITAKIAELDKLFKPCQYHGEGRYIQISPKTGNTLLVEVWRVKSTGKLAYYQAVVRDCAKLPEVNKHKGKPFTPPAADKPGKLWSAT